MSVSWQSFINSSEYIEILDITEWAGGDSEELFQTVVELDTTNVANLKLLGGLLSRLHIMSSEFVYDLAKFCHTVFGWNRNFLETKLFAYQQHRKEMYGSRATAFSADREATT